MTAKRLLEVEAKFGFRPSLITRLRSNGGNPAFKRLEALGMHKFTDTYYDRQDVLSKKGIWLRQRTDNNSAILEAKVRVSGDFARSTFHEIKDRKTIVDLIQPHFPQFSEEREHFGIGVLAEFTTTRQNFRVDHKFAIMLDSTDFGHSVGEVELMAEDEEKAHQEIDAFMSQYPWFFKGSTCEGKLAAYLRIRGIDTSK
ncbi:MAG: hypothetical protein LQ343_001808 [Gyalolechia ehrenbergii]|nr:MAG: hypothetical protein LQ343_001808 [Gyalolechia ehrenbergii]